jgi:hypothetical protein
VRYLLQRLTLQLGPKAHTLSKALAQARVQALTLTLAFLALALLGQACAPKVTPLEYEEAYQIGPEWGRVRVTPELLFEAKTKDPILYQAVTSTGRLIGGQNYGTAFHIGFHKNQPITATNEHVVRLLSDCFSRLRHAFRD